MKARDPLTRTLALLGTVLVWSPIAVTLAMSLLGSIAERPFPMDCLIPAELSPAVLVGGALSGGPSPYPLD